MKRRIVLVAPPRFEGRPEGSIMDAILNAVANHLSIDSEKAKYLFGEGYGAPSPGEVYEPILFLEHIQKMNQKIFEDMDMHRGNTVYFFGEAWWPGLDMIFYYNDINKFDNRFVGLFHSASMVPGDFAENWEWATCSENTWMKGLDAVVVATEYLRRKLNWAKLHRERCKVTVTGLPVPLPLTQPTRLATGLATRFPFKPGEDGKFVVIFNHRVSEDKGWGAFVQLALEDKTNMFRYRLLTPVPIQFGNTPRFIEVRICKDKKKYYEELAKGHFVISFATLETFGYSVIEGVLHGLCPIVPDTASYPEMYPDKVLFSAINIKDKRRFAMDAFRKQKFLLTRCTRKPIIFESLFDYINGDRKIADVLLEEANK